MQILHTNPAPTFTLFLRSGLDDRHQLGRLCRGAFNYLRLFAHMRYLDALEHCFDALVYLSQRLPYVATIALAALSPNGDAGSDKQWSIDRLNHLESRDRVRGPS